MSTYWKLHAQTTQTKKIVIKWDATKRENYIENFDVMEAAAIETKLNEIFE